MTLSAPSFECPKCKGPIALATPAEFAERKDYEHRCLNCSWRGKVYTFHPVAYKIERAQAALADDAVCLHHPTKRATAICAGTGDYICTLCVIEVDGKVFGAHYLNSAGKETATKAFSKRLPRPDSEVLIACIMALPFWFVSPFPVGYGVYRFIQAVKLRKTNPLYADVISPARIITLGIIGGLAGLGGLTLFCAVIAGAIFSKLHF